MKIYTSNSVTESISDINTTVKGGSYINVEGKKSSLPDSKDVSKRKKELRIGTAYIARSEKNEAYKLLSNAITQDTRGQLSAADIKVITTSLSSHIGEFIEAITGSKKYNEMASNYTAATLSRTLLNYIQTSNSSTQEDSSNNKKKKK